MKTTKLIRPLVIVLLASGIAPRLCHAYVDIELESGRHVIGQSYTDKAGKLTVYRPSGAIEIDRVSVRSIHEPSGDMPAEGGTANESPAPATDAQPPTKAAIRVEPSKDPAEREHQLSHQLIHMRLNRLAALQRGDDETMKNLDKQINKLQDERQSNWKKLHPTDGEASND